MGGDSGDQPSHEGSLREMKIQRYGDAGVLSRNLLEIEKNWRFSVPCLIFDILATFCLAGPFYKIRLYGSVVDGCRVA